MARRWMVTERWGATAGGVGAIALLAAVTATYPSANVVSVPLLVLAAVAASHRAATTRMSRSVVAGVVVATLLVLVTIAPKAAAVGAAAACAFALATRRTSLRSDQIRRAATRAATLLARAGGVAAVIVAIAALAIAVAVFPATTLLAAIVSGILVLAWRAPAAALAAAVLLFAFEGSVKILLGLDHTPLPGGNRAGGAAAIDIALAASIAGVLVRDRFRAPRAIWSAATRVERIAILVIGAWLALSVLQIAQGGNISRGVHGFRLFQWYTLVALAALTVFSHPRLRSVAVRGVLAIGLIVSLYAAVRVVFGPTDAERAFATSVPTITTYGNTVRAIGSFSSAIGLSSFLTPVAVFTLVLGLLSARARLVAWTVAALALVGLIGSFSRTSLFGVALGVICALLLVLLTGDMSPRRKLGSAAVILGILAAAYGGLLVASHTSPQLRDRAKGVLDPFGDPSVKLRFDNWRNTLQDAGQHPLGRGIGAVGAASSPTRARVRTTDNSFLKVLVEQGVLGLALFAGGMLAAVILLASRLRRTAAQYRPVGLAALAGFVSFLGISFAGESVEQPGKIAAWGLLGIAAALAFATARPVRATENDAT